MGNRLDQLLEIWFHNKDDCQWVLATIFETKGSAYRKAGAKMLINSNGQIFGLLSGGCLESDLMRKAQKCFFLVVMSSLFMICKVMRIFHGN